MPVALSIVRNRGVSWSNAAAAQALNEPRIAATGQVAVSNKVLGVPAVGPVPCADPSRAHLFPPTVRAASGLYRFSVRASHNAHRLFHLHIVTAS